MKFHIKINLNALDNIVYTGALITSNFHDVSNQDYWNVQETDAFFIELSDASKRIDFYYTSGGGESHTTNFSSLSTNAQYIEFNGELITSEIDLNAFVKLGIIEVSPIDNNAVLFECYKQNSPNNVLNKSLTFVRYLVGKFNHSIGLKNINVDCFNYERNFNYVFLPKLNRYYYIDSLDFITSDFTRLHLKEDVLTSWANLIRLQSAFVTRRENGNNSNVLKDDRLPLEDKISYEYFDSLRNGDLKNITFDYSTIGYRFTCLSFTTISEHVADSSNIVAPTNSGLPDIMPTLNSKTCMTFMQRLTLNWLIHGIYADSSKASYVENLMWLPFDPLSVFSTLTSAYSKIYVGDKVLGTNGDWVNYNSRDIADCRLSQTMGSPYLVIADFFFNAAGGVITPTPATRMQYYNSYWEIYIPFVGWVNVEFTKVFNKRILIYYTMDMKTGISTAYIYNYTDKKVLYSTTCTLGIKIDFTTSNALENTKQKQANDLNMIISGLSSAVSIGVGVATENPVAVVGGVLSMGKSIASYVNNNNMIIERANTSFGTSNGALYSQNFVSVRRSYHAPIFIDTTTYAKTQGYPYNGYMDTLSFVTGYIEIGEIKFNPMNEVIYQDEITEIVSLLKDGVII